MTFITRNLANLVSIMFGTMAIAAAVVLLSR
jgi:hypothetical protein